ncbi:MAG: CoA transferase [Bacteroidetes bacterium]|nr:CoA transferase [Bacteroidota bacterium]
MISDFFSDLKILDLSSVLAGPSVGTYFAEMGAKVLKLEHPVHGDVTRTWRLPSETDPTLISSYFSAVNFGKEYRKFDLSDTSRKVELHDLIRNADLLLSNFKKGDAEKFGLTDNELKAIKPNLIHGKISGFGSDNDRVAYDLILQAETGFMSLNGDENSLPTKMPVALIDVLAAHHLKEGLLIALLKKEKTGQGSILEVSLYDAAVASLMNQASAYLMNGVVGKRIGSKHPNIAPYGELFLTKDKEYVTFAIGSDQHFKLLCKVLDIIELIDDVRYCNNPQRVIHRVELFEQLNEKVVLFDSSVLLDKLHLLHVPCGIVNHLDRVLNQPSAHRLILEEKINEQNTKRIRSMIVQWK